MFTIKDFLICWNGLFFNQINYPSLGVFRILIGMICLCKIFLSLKNRYEYFGVKGIFPYGSWKNQKNKSICFSVFHYLKPSDFSVDLVLFFSIIFSLFLTIGFCTNLSCFMTYCLFLSLNNRNNYIWNAGDCLLRIILVLMIFSGCDCYISVDNIIYGRKQLETCISPWVVRLMQILLLNVYFHAVYSKLHEGEVWIKGTGVYYSLSNRMVARYNLAPYVNKYIFLILNYFALISQSFFALGLIFKETSTICAFTLIFMHLSFEFLLRINLFGSIVAACLVLFLNNDIMVEILTLFTMQGY